MRFEISDDYVDAARPQQLRLFQHLERLSDAGGVTHENLESAALMFRHGY
jgi:hypothetical protein